MYLFRDFVRHCNQLSLDLFNESTFPAKKKPGALNTYAPFFLFIDSVSNICSTVADFPAKRLRKNTVLKNTHAPIFFFFNATFIVSTYIFTIYVNKNINSVLSFLIYTQYTKHVPFNKSICLFSIAS